MEKFCYGKPYQTVEKNTDQREILSEESDLVIPGIENHAQKPERFIAIKTSSSSDLALTVSHWTKVLFLAVLLIFVFWKEGGVENVSGF